MNLGSLWVEVLDNSCGHDRANLVGMISTHTIYTCKYGIRSRGLRIMELLFENGRVEDLDEDLDRKGRI